LELKEKYGILGSFDTFMKKFMEKKSIDVLELGFWFLTLEKWFVVFIFSCFGRKYEKRKVHNMLSLMLTPKFKNLLLMCSFIALEQGKVIVEAYDEKILYPMLLKCYHHLHPFFKNVTID